MKKLYLLSTLLFSVVLVKSQLQAPVLSSPANAALTVDVNIRLTWSPSLGGTVTGYDAQISVDSAFTSPVSLPVWGTSAKCSELEFNKKYFWRVRAIGSSSNFSPYAVTRSFTTFNNEFTTLGPVTPDQEPELYLRWDTVPGVTEYTYQYDDDSLFGSPVSGTVAQPTEEIARGLLTDLLFGQTYYWRTRAEHTKDQSNWSVVNSFSVMSKVVLKNPLDSATEITPKYKLECVNYKGITEYRFMIDDSVDFDFNSKYFSLYSVLDKNFGANNNISVLTQLLGFNRFFYWKVQAVNNSGVSDWSDIWTIHTLSGVTLVKPANGAVKVPTKGANFSWTKVDGVESYEMHYGTDPTLATYTKIITLGDTANEIKNLDLTQWDLPYYWRVRAMHVKDTSAWSPIFAFNATPSGIADISNLNSIQLYPNPANNEFYIELLATKNTSVSFELYNIVGEKIDQKVWNVFSGEQTYKYDISSINSGVYVLTIEMDGVKTSKRLTIK